MKQGIMVLGWLLAGGGSIFAQSLWTAPGSQERSWFADHVATQVGDIVTVIIEERQSIQDDGKIELSKDSSMDSAIQVLDIKPNAFNTLPAVRYGHSRSVEGETKYQQTATWQTTISCVVTDAKRNGNLVIEGHRVLQLDGEWKDVRVQGLIRSVDISSDNQISSDKIANAGLRYDTEGERSYHNEKSWLDVILDWVWPF